MRDEIRAALGCAPEISSRPKHFHTSLSTTSTPRISGPRGLSGGSCTPGSISGAGTALTTATASPGTYRYNNGNGIHIGGTRANATVNQPYIGDGRNGLTSHGNTSISNTCR